MGGKKCIFMQYFRIIRTSCWFPQAKLEKCSREVKFVGQRINKLTYVFPCNMAATDDPDGVKLFGTGGKYIYIYAFLFHTSVSSTAVNCGFPDFLALARMHIKILYINIV